MGRLVSYEYYGSLLCAFYPTMIGAQKALLKKIVLPFEMDEVYEFSSLAFASMPYRFLFLSVSSWPSASIILAIKFIYKLITYVLALRYKKHINKLK